MASGTTISANWLANSGNQWTVPIGGGFGKIFRMGKFFYSASAQGFYNVTTPDGIGRWMAIAQFQIIFTQ